MVPNSCQIFGITLPLSLCLKNLELENSKLARGPFILFLVLFYFWFINICFILDCHLIVLWWSRVLITLS